MKMNKRKKIYLCKKECSPGRRGLSWLHAIAGVTLLVSLCLAPAVYAFEIPTCNPDLNIRWDNTIKYSSAWRLEDRCDTLTKDINQDDGDRNFNRGFISNRWDLLTELDVILKKGLVNAVGFRVTAAAWYDSIYNTENDNDSPATINQTSRPYNDFTKHTRDLHGRDGELLDSFVFARHAVGREGRVNIRIGRFAQMWGQTLFFGANGIAGGMAPVDVIKALAVPGSQFKEIIRPVGQIGLDYTVNSFLAIGAYYQYEWDHTRLPGVGSYFSNQDLMIVGGERFLLAPGFGLRKGDDMEASDQGQFGVQVRFRLPNGLTTYGLYAIRYHDKTPNPYLRPWAMIPGFSTFDYRLMYHEGIRSYGASASRTWGYLNLATEISYRDNAPLVNPGVALMPPDFKADNNNHPRYPVGKTFHANLSAVWNAPRTPLFQEGTLMAELAYNRRLSIDKNRSALSSNSHRDALGFRFVFTPTYRQVLVSNLDVDVPIGMGYNPMGASSAVAGFNGGLDEGGDCSIGLNFTYRQVWKAGLLYTHYIGAKGTSLTSGGDLSFDQCYGDRDFISLQFQRTF